MTTISGIKPTGHMQLGNYLGAVRRWTAPHYAGSLFFVADLHAFTVEHDPHEVSALSREMFTLLLAAGIDADACTVFVQSDVAAHTELAYLLECTATFGEMRRMIQFKEKSAGRESVRLSLLTYPALMAADILLYGADSVPVSADQSQHVELARTLARRFNSSYSETFVVPHAALPETAQRVMDLAEPTRKMAKSTHDQAGVVGVLDGPDVIRAKIQRAVTDTDGEIRHDPVTKPGVSNLLEILAATTGQPLADVAADVCGYRALKERAADAVICALQPLQRRYAHLISEPETVDDLRRHGAERATRRAAPRLAAARTAFGLAPLDRCRTTRGS
ncbi:MAG: tryptophan--tRNA ligase [Mycobacteriales bacterium]|nr:MAG: tryptophan--tRNA ligase [Pseudonocardiales bacterium]